MFAPAFTINFSFIAKSLVMWWTPPLPIVPGTPLEEFEHGGASGCGETVSSALWTASFVERGIKMYVNVMFSSVVRPLSDGVCVGGTEGILSVPCEQRSAKLSFNVLWKNKGLRNNLGILLPKS